jgi:hypothetical protein
VLAGAVVEDRLRRTALLGPDLEVVLGRRSLRQQPSYGLDLLRLGTMGSRRDRDVLVVEVAPGANERQRLEGLRRGAERGEQDGIAGLCDDSAILHRDRVHDVLGFHERPPVHGYADWIHEAGSVSARVA